MALAHPCRYPGPYRWLLKFNSSLLDALLDVLRMGNSENAAQGLQKSKGCESERPFATFCERRRALRGLHRLRVRSRLPPANLVCERRGFCRLGPRRLRQLRWGSAPGRQHVGACKLVHACPRPCRTDQRSDKTALASPGRMPRPRPSRRSPGDSLPSMLSRMVAWNANTCSVTAPSDLVRAGAKLAGVGCTYRLCE